MLIEAAKGGHTNVVSYLLDYPNNILSVQAPDLSQLTPPSQDASQVYPAKIADALNTNPHFVLAHTNISLVVTGPSCSIPSSRYGCSPSGARQSPIKHRNAPTRLQQR